MERDSWNTKNANPLKQMNFKKYEKLWASEVRLGFLKSAMCENFQLTLLLSFFFY